MAHLPRSTSVLRPAVRATTPTPHPLSRALRQTARMVEAPGHGVRKLAQSVGHAAQLGDRSLRSLTNSLFAAFRARELCVERESAPH